MNNQPEVNGVPVVVKDEFVHKYSLMDFISALWPLMPESYYETVDVIYIGQWPENIKRQLVAHYRDAAIFVSNDQTDLEVLIGAVVHEFAHAVSEAYHDLIANDTTIANEFKNKRKYFHRLVSVYYPDKAKELDHSAIFNTEYSVDFDNFLHKIVGYNTVNTIMKNAILSPYSLTSLEEYFAEGFQHFYYGTPQTKEKLEVVSPALFRKLEDLEDGERPS